MNLYKVITNMYQEAVYVCLGRPKLDCCPDKSTAWQNQTAIKGKSKSLDCSAAGYPKPSYRWAFENKMISSSPVFTISSVSRSDEGVFSCTANNTHGEVKLMIYLNVLGKCCMV